MIIFGPSPNVRAREKKKLKFLIIEVKILPVGTNAENLTGKNNSKNHDKRHISTINQSIRFRPLNLCPTWPLHHALSFHLTDIKGRSRLAGYSMYVA